MSNCHCTPQREKSIAFTLDARLVDLELYAKIEKGGRGGERLSFSKEMCFQKRPESGRGEKMSDTARECDSGKAAKKRQIFDPCVVWFERWHSETPTIRREAQLTRREISEVREMLWVSTNRYFRSL